MLFLKMLRDVRKNFSQFLMIFLMVLLGTAACSGIDGYIQGMQSAVDRFYKDGKLQDLNIRGALSEEDLKKVSEFDGVQKAEGKLVAKGQVLNILKAKNEPSEQSQTTTNTGTKNNNQETEAQKIDEQNKEYEDYKLELNLLRSNEIAKFTVEQGEGFAASSDKIWIDAYFAKKNQLKVNDEIIKINGQSLTEAEKLPVITKQSSGKKVRVEYRRDGKESSVDVQLNDEKSAKGSGYLGVIPGQTEKMYSTWSAPIVGVATTGQLSYETIKGVGVLLVKTVHGSIGQIFGSAESKESARADLASVSGSVAGPIGILGVLFPSVVSSGIEYIIFVAALISLTLAVMNILPIPALDGGRWFTMTIFRLFKKDLTKEREENIQATGMLILLILTILVTISDVGKLF